MSTQQAEVFLLEQLKLANRIKESFQGVRTPHTRGLLTARLQTLEANFVKFQSQHVELLKSTLNKDIEYFKDDLSSQVEEWYQTLKGLYLDAFDSISSRDANESSINDTHRISSNSTKSFPKITLPTFSGNYTEWSNFSDLFKSLIDGNSEIADVVKLHHLKTNLSGEPAQLLKNIPVTNDNYKRAWKLLVDRYENKRILINCHLSTIFSLRPLLAESSAGLKQLVNTAIENLEALKALDCLVDSWSPFLVFFLTNCLDHQTRREWETSLGDSTEPPSYQSLRTFLSNRVRTLEILEGNSTEAGASSSASKDSSNLRSSANSQASKRNRGYRGATKGSAATSHVTTDQIVDQGRKCYNCGQQHFLMYCPQFRALNAVQRKELASKKKLCYNCLRQHFGNECSSSRKCHICDKKHHTMLHQDTSAINHIKKSSTAEEEKSQSSTSHHLFAHHVTRPRAKGLLPTAILRVTSNNGASELVRALLDIGSEVSLVSESLAQRLRLSRSSCDLGLLTVGKKRASMTNGAVSCILSPYFKSDFEYHLDALVLPRLTPYLPHFQRDTGEWPHISGLRLADPDLGSNRVIEVIIRADAYPYLLLPNIRKSTSTAPVAQETYFGWILSGKTIGNLPTATTYESNTAVGMHISLQEDVSFDLQKFWEEQEIPPKIILTADDQECEDFFVATHSRTPEEGRYVVRLPMKRNLQSFGNSYRPALRMLHRQERRLARDVTLFEAYDKFLDEYLTLGHMVHDNETSVRRDCSRSFYLPHHGVWKTSSTTTKLRVIFNGSQRTEVGISLNECFYVGPSILTNLMDIVLRWRLHVIVVCADVEKMYRQIQVHRDDQDLQLILWRKSPEDLVQTFRLTTVTYGLSCAPFLALRCLKQLAIDEGLNYPLAAKAIHQGTYVDDVITGADTLEEAVLLQNQLHHLFRVGGFPLRKWMSNDPDLLKKIPEEHQASSQPKSLSTQKSVQMLGLNWNPEKDVFTFDVELPACMPVVTKRSVLSQIAQLFDPLGWLSPVIITAKIFIQLLWLSKISWDDPLPIKEHNQWLEYRDNLRYFSGIEIPRWIGFRSSSGCYELHGFCDASERAYAAAVYILVRSTSGESDVSLVASKSKVAPVKQLSLPRLELCGAVRLVHLMQYVQQTFNLDVPVHLWSDSTDTLDWIKGHPTRWKTFIANRVSEIQTTLPSAQWHYVPSADNPADCASRGISAKNLASFTLWWKGPDWLTSSSIWPVRPPSRKKNKVDMEEREVQVNTATIVLILWELLHRFSTLEKLLRTTAWILRFLLYLRHPSDPMKPVLTPIELHSANLAWIRHEQHHYFGAEIKILTSRKKISPKNKLARLTPYLDAEQLLRVGGRLKNSILNPDEKHPLILASESTLTTLLVVYHHRRCLHGGVQLTLGTLRQQYWILKGRSVVKTLIHRCLPCLRQRATTSQQLMGDLPAIRSSPSRPFLHTGVDYAGPIRLRTTKGRGHKSYKGYIAVFVCCSTRAVHLEVVSDYTANGFLAAYTRFVSRRGISKTLSSDQGTNFIGADANLRAMFTSASKQSKFIASVLAADGTEWRFNPPGAPHFGGLWEAAVKSSKHHIRRVLGERTLTFEEMSTFFSQVEACLNSRPLQAMSDDPEDLSALTPGHFLIGEPLNNIPEPNLLEIPVTRLTRWQLVQQMQQHFWHRWSSDYLKELQPRSKWRSTSPSMEIGDLALIRDENLPPTKWALGRIIDLHPGSDGHVRVVKLRTKGGVLERPIVKLCLLPKAVKEVM